MFRNSLVYLVGRYGASALNALALAAFTRLLSPGDYGIYALVFSSALTAYAGFYQWLRQSINRLMPAYNDKLEDFISNVSLLFLISTVLVWTSGAIALIFISDTILFWQIALGMLLTGALGLGEVSIGIPQSQFKSITYSILLLLRTIACIFCSLILISLGYGWAGLVVGTTLGFVISSLPTMKLIVRESKIKNLNRAIIREIAVFGLPYALGGVLGAITAMSDRYIIVALVGTDAAGLYSASFDLTVRSLQAVLIAINLAGSPYIYRAFEAGGIESAQPFLTRQAQLLLAVGLPTTAALSVLTPWITSLMLGKPFQASAVELMPLIAITTMISAFETLYFALSFSLSKRLKSMLVLQAILLLVKTIISYTFISSFGIQGAVISSLVSAAISLLCTIIIGRKLVYLPFITADILKFGAATSVLICILWPVRHEVATIRVVSYAAVASFAYAVVVVLLDAANAREITRRYIKVIY